MAEIEFSKCHQMFLKIFRPPADILGVENSGTALEYLIDFKLGFVVLGESLGTKS